MLLVLLCRSRYLFPLRYVCRCLQLKGLNISCAYLSEWPSDNDVTIHPPMILVPRCRSRYLFPLRYVCRCLQLNNGELAEKQSLIREEGGLLKTYQNWKHIYD
jgi:hypothetical protein